MLPVRVVVHVGVVRVGVVRVGVEEGVKVEDECLEVLGALLKFPNLLVAAGLIVQHADNDVLIDVLSAAGCVLQDLLGLSQVHQRLFRPFHVYALLGLAAQLHHALDELL